MDAEVTLTEKRNWLVDDISGITAEDVRSLTPQNYDEMLEDGWGEARLAAEAYVCALSESQIAAEFERRRSKGKEQFTRPANFGFWSNFYRWSFEEAVALSFGYEPTPGLLLWAARHRTALPEAADINLRSIAMQRQATFEVAAQGIIPNEMFAWLKAKKYPAPAWTPLGERAAPNDASPTATLAADNSQGVVGLKNELAVLQRKYKNDLDGLRVLIAAIALHNGYREGQSSGAVGTMYVNICGRLQDYGRKPPKEETLRNYIKEGISLLKDSGVEPRQVRAHKRRQKRVKPTV